MAAQTSNLRIKALWSKVVSKPIDATNKNLLWVTRKKVRPKQSVLRSSKIRQKLRRNLVRNKKVLKSRWNSCRKSFRITWRKLSWKNKNKPKTLQKQTKMKLLAGMDQEVVPVMTALCHSQTINLIGTVILILKLRLIITIIMLKRRTIRKRSIIINIIGLRRSHTTTKNKNPVKKMTKKSKS